MRHLSIAMLFCAAFALLAYSAVTADGCETSADTACGSEPTATGPDVVDGAALPALTAAELAFVPITATAAAPASD